jgi:hypothetical protein
MPPKIPRKKSPKKVVPKKLPPVEGNHVLKLVDSALG